MPTPTTTRKSNRTLWLSVAAVAVLLILLVRHFTGNIVLVRTAKVERQDLVSTLATNGNVEPLQNFEAHSPIAGTVKAIYVHEGDIVPKGKLLLEMDDSAVKSQVASALAAMRTAQAAADAVQQGGTREEQLQLDADIAKTRANRDQMATTLATLTKLEQSGSSSPSEIANAKNQLAIANATLQNLEQRKTQRYAAVDHQRVAADVANAQAAYQAAMDTLRQENVRAPFPGTVYSIPVQASEYVQAGDALLKMADLTHVQIRAYFDEPEIGRLSVGQPITIVWDARPGRVWHGHIMRTPSTIITYGTRHVGEAIIAVDDADGVLLPNTNVILTVTTNRLSNVLTIPREALHLDDQEDYVYRVVGDHLRKTPIKIGVPNLTMVPVLSGLDENATVALSAPDGTNLHDGLTVRSVQ
ncbi:MAG TPA: efflux RND transporter periplasmic adaptor subunit [Acidobacteriaceae bacterium]|nr:efflux RND transporter periplasmic adaptor subunit [Acidobacteriaceae bacterium]